MVDDILNNALIFDESKMALLPIKQFEGEVFIIDKEEDIFSAVEELKKSKIIGFDTETRPSFKKGGKNKVALLQLSTADKAYLFRLNRITINDAIASLLADESIMKIGVAIHDDIKFLLKNNKFIPGGFIDLQTYVKSFGINVFGLKKLSSLILGYRISKAQQLSNWENEKLTESQLRYAATDAWVCREIYLELRNNHKYYNGKD